ncbi:MAG: phosphoglycerate dehydrogenase, partial [Alphaproteobacteria bacterium]|nr:phosphoglycerate dehydrogenase [Alphaproteobacteria bacterium]
MAKVLIADAMSPRAAAALRDRGIDVDENTGLSPDELAAIIGDYDGIAVRSSTKVTEAILKAGSRLKVVGRAGIGVDNVDVAAATARG